MNPNSYREAVTYDKNGNIKTMNRNGNLDDNAYSIEIDDLDYTYKNDNSNQLVKVFDHTNNAAGFKDDSDGTSDPAEDYTYDDNGNMKTDTNKGITAITYNHLNLPVKIEFGASKNIVYLYNAVGKKVIKTVTNGIFVNTTDYLDGFQYIKTGATGTAKLQFFPHAEGYVSNTVVSNNNVYKYIFNYQDHLGNNRLSYTFDTTTNTTKILEENNYYPFGLQHKNYNWNKSYYDAVNSGGGGVLIQVTPSPFRYKYNGKELQDELGLNMYDYGAMMYDPATGRRNNVDPKAETSRRWSPYSYVYNNPLSFIDPDGMQAMHVKITGEDAKKATKELDKSTNLKLTRDEKTGLLSATGEAKNDYDKTLLAAINSPDVTVNLKTTTSETIAVGGAKGDVVVGAYAGSSKTKDGKVEATQFINMNHAKKVEDAGVTKQGNLVGHEVNESFIAAQENSGVNQPNSANGDAAYNKGHTEAVKVDPNFVESDSYNNVLGQKFLGFPSTTVKLN